MSNRLHRRRAKTRDKPKAARPGLSLTRFGIPPEKHEDFKRAVSEVARASADAFPATIERLVGLLKRHSPEGVLATFSLYGLMAMVGETEMKGFLSDPQQHHAEVLQALILSIPPDEWGFEPSSKPGVMQTFFDDVPKLADAFFHKRLLEADDEKTADKMAVHSLQERVRLHTQAVRNWSYYQDIIRISRELYGGLDRDFVAAVGFSASDLILVAEALVRLLEQRTSAHWTRFAKVNRGRNTAQVVRLYFKHVPDLEGTPEQMLSAVPADLPRETMLAMVMSHYDLRLPDLATFTVQEIAQETGLEEERVAKIMDALSLQPGALASATVEHFFLTNPTWVKPAIKFPDRYFVPIPQAIFSHIHDVMGAIAESANFKAKLEAQRARYLQEKLEHTLRAALPMASVTPGAKWKVGDQQFETDALVVVDKTVLIAEAKANRLTAQGLRGAPDRVKRHVTDMVIAPSVQSARLADLIAAAKLGDRDAQAVIAPLGIDAAKIDNVIRLSVTLDDLSVLSSAEGDIRDAGWIESGHVLSPTITIADLGSIIEILDNPLLLLHYLAERIYLQKAFELLGDEMDFLGLYLSSGFNLAGLEAENMQFVPDGMSKSIDRFFDARDAGLTLPKPKAQLDPLFRSIIDRLADKRPEGWTSVGMHVLGCADPEEQRRGAKALERLRADVRKNFRSPGHVNSMGITPPKARKSPVVFYLFAPDALEERREAMEEMAARGLESGRPACVVIAKNIGDWAAPYATILYVQRPVPAPVDSADAETGKEQRHG
jgi:hypothetical protein